VGRTRRRLPGAGTETKRSWRWCVKRSRGKVRAAFTRKGKVALIATSAARHRAGAVHPGRRVGRNGLVRIDKRRFMRVRGGKVRYVVVASPGVAKSRRLLRRYLKLAGL
jgi:hypothetical protein